jgi:putative transposase
MGRSLREPCLENFHYIEYTIVMEQVLTVSCKLEVTPEHTGKLDQTLQVFAEACLAIHDTIPPNITNRVRMQTMIYQDIRARFGLSANLTIQAIRRVAANRKAATSLRGTVQTFRPTSIEYDARIFSFRERDWTVSLTLLSSRERFPLAIGNYQRGLLRGQQPKSATLIKRRDGDYYIQIHLSSTVDDPTPPDDVLGVDLGRRDIAHTSDGQSFSGEAVSRVRDRFATQRASLQQKASKGTRSTRRRCRQLLQRLSGRERRFQAWVNHTISYRLVQYAKAHNMAIAMEDLTGIRERTNNRPRQRTERRRSNHWAFYQLRQFVTYKTVRASVLLLLVCAAYTSQTCYLCLHIGHRSGKRFSCATCGNQCDADWNASQNIKALGAAVNRPEGSGWSCPWPDRFRALESLRL